MEIRKIAKKPVVLNGIEVAFEQVVQTKEGPQTAFEGDIIITGLKGEKWAVRPTLIQERYEILRQGWLDSFGEYRYTLQAKPVPIDGYVADVDVHMKTNWGEATAKAGDWVVRYGPNDFNVVGQQFFEGLYDILGASELTEADFNFEVIE